MFDNRAPDDDDTLLQISLFDFQPRHDECLSSIHENVYPLSYLGNFHGRMEEEKRKQREEKYVGHAKLVRSCVRFIVEKGWRVGGRPRKFRKLHFRRDETNAEEAKKSLPRYVI